MNIRLTLKGLFTATCLVALCGLAQPAAAQTQLITNGGFETGDFTGWTVNDLANGSGSFFVHSGNNDTPLNGTIFNTAGAASGDFFALSDQTGPGTHALTQMFTVSAGSIVNLSFDMFINDYSQAGPIFGAQGLNHLGDPNQYARVDILSAGASAFDTGAGVIANLFGGVDSGQEPNPYTSYNFDITQYVGAGGTFALRFAEVDNRGNFHQGIDNVSLLASNSANAVPEPATMILFGSGMIGAFVRKRSKA